MSETFYKGMFQLMIQLIKGSEINSVINLLRVFSRVNGISENISDRPILKEYLNMHIDNMKLADLWTIYKIYERDVVFCE